jgi:hypothetical protein
LVAVITGLDNQEDQVVVVQMLCLIPLVRPLAVLEVMEQQDHKAILAVEDLEMVEEEAVPAVLAYQLHLMQVIMVPLKVAAQAHFGHIQIHTMLAVAAMATVEQVAPAVAALDQGRQLVILVNLAQLALVVAAERIILLDMLDVPQKLVLAVLV